MRFCNTAKEVNNRVVTTWLIPHRYDSKLAAIRTEMMTNRCILS